MIVKNMKEANETKIESFPYRGKPLKVKDVWIRWLSQAGPQDAPNTGFVFFTIGPKGVIPIHNHFYHQTMYILSGRLLVVSHDAKTDEKIEEKRWSP